MVAKNIMFAGVLRNSPASSLSKLRPLHSVHLIYSPHFWFVQRSLFTSSRVSQSWQRIAYWHPYILLYESLHDPESYIFAEDSSLHGDARYDSRAGAIIELRRAMAPVDEGTLFPIAIRHSSQPLVISKNIVRIPFRF